MSFIKKFFKKGQKAPHRSLKKADKSVVHILRTRALEIRDLSPDSRTLRPLVESYIEYIMSNKRVFFIALRKAGSKGGEAWVNALMEILRDYFISISERNVMRYSLTYIEESNLPVLLLLVETFKYCLVDTALSNFVVESTLLTKRLAAAFSQLAATRPANAGAPLLVDRLEEGNAVSRVEWSEKDVSLAIARDIAKIIGEITRLHPQDFEENAAMLLRLVDECVRADSEWHVFSSISLLESLFQHHLHYDREDSIQFLMDFVSETSDPHMLYAVILASIKNILAEMNNEHSALYAEITDRIVSFPDSDKGSIALQLEERAVSQFSGLVWTRADKDGDNPRDVNTAFVPSYRKIAKHAAEKHFHNPGLEGRLFDSVIEFISRSRENYMAMREVFVLILGDMDNTPGNENAEKIFNVLNSEFIFVQGAIPDVELKQLVQSALYNALNNESTVYAKLNFVNKVIKIILQFSNISPKMDETIQSLNVFKNVFDPLIDMLLDKNSDDSNSLSGPFNTLIKSLVLMSAKSTGAQTRDENSVTTRILDLSTQRDMNLEIRLASLNFLSLSMFKSSSNRYDYLGFLIRNAGDLLLGAPPAMVRRVFQIIEAVSKNPRMFARLYSNREVRDSIFRAIPTLLGSDTTWFEHCLRIFINMASIPEASGYLENDLEQFASAILSQNPTPDVVSSLIEVLLQKTFDNLSRNALHLCKISNPVLIPLVIRLLPHARIQDRIDACEIFYKSCSVIRQNREHLARSGVASALLRRQVEGDIGPEEEEAIFRVLSVGMGQIIRGHDLEYMLSEASKNDSLKDSFLHFLGSHNTGHRERNYVEFDFSDGGIDKVLDLSKKGVVGTEFTFGTDIEFDYSQDLDFCLMVLSVDDLKLSIDVRSRVLHITASGGISTLIDGITLELKKWSSLLFDFSLSRSEFILDIESSGFTKRLKGDLGSQFHYGKRENSISLVVLPEKSEKFVERKLRFRLGPTFLRRGDQSHTQERLSSFDKYIIVHPRDGVGKILELDSTHISEDNRSVLDIDYSIEIGKALNVLAYKSRSLSKAVQDAGGFKYLARMLSISVQASHVYDSVKFSLSYMEYLNRDKEVGYLLVSRFLREKSATLSSKRFVDMVCYHLGYNRLCLEMNKIKNGLWAEYLIDWKIWGKNPYVKTLFVNLSNFLRAKNPNVPHNLEVLKRDSIVSNILVFIKKLADGQAILSVIFLLSKILTLTRSERIAEIVMDFLYYDCFLSGDFNSSKGPLYLIQDLSDISASSEEINGYFSKRLTPSFMSRVLESSVSKKLKTAMLGMCLSIVQQQGHEIYPQWKSPVAQHLFRRQIPDHLHSYRDAYSVVLPFAYGKTPNSIVLQFKNDRWDLRMAKTSTFLMFPHVMHGFLTMCIRGQESSPGLLPVIISHFHEHLKDYYSFFADLRAFNLLMDLDDRSILLGLLSDFLLESLSRSEVDFERAVSFLHAKDGDLLTSVILALISSECFEKVEEPRRAFSKILNICLVPEYTPRLGLPILRCYRKFLDKTFSKDRLQYTTELKKGLHKWLFTDIERLLACLFSDSSGTGGELLEVLYEMQDVLIHNRLFALMKKIAIYALRIFQILKPGDEREFSMASAIFRRIVREDYQVLGELKFAKMQTLVNVTKADTIDSVRELVDAIDSSAVLEALSGLAETEKSRRIYLNKMDTIFKKWKLNEYMKETKMNSKKYSEHIRQYTAYMQRREAEIQLERDMKNFLMSEMESFYLGLSGARFSYEESSSLIAAYLYSKYDVVLVQPIVLGGRECVLYVIEIDGRRYFYIYRRGKNIYRGYTRWDLSIRSGALCVYTIGKSASFIRVDRDYLLFEGADFRNSRFFTVDSHRLLEHLFGVCCTPFELLVELTALFGRDKLPDLGGDRITIDQVTSNAPNVRIPAVPRGFQDEEMVKKFIYEEFGIKVDRLFLGAHAEEPDRCLSCTIGQKKRYLNFYLDLSCRKREKVQYVDSLHKKVIKFSCYRRRLYTLSPKGRLRVYSVSLYKYVSLTLDEVLDWISDFALHRGEFVVTYSSTEGKICLRRCAGSLSDVVWTKEVQNLRQMSITGRFGYIGILHGTKFQILNRHSAVIFEHEVALDVIGFRMEDSFMHSGCFSVEFTHRDGTLEVVPASL